MKRVKKIEPRIFKHLTTLIGITDCLSDRFAAKEYKSSLETKNHLLNHTCIPKQSHSVSQFLKILLEKILLQMYKN